MIGNAFCQAQGFYESRLHLSGGLAVAFLG